MSKGNAGLPTSPPSSALPEAARAPASSLASEKSINNSSRSRSRSKRWMRDEIVAVPSNASSFPAAEDHSDNPHDETEFKHLFDEKAKGSCHRKHGPIDLMYNIFTCWSRDRTKSGSYQHMSGRPRVNSFAAAALLEQNRLQQEALVESHETRDMWEWEMEQQRLITCEELDVLERNHIEMNPLLGHLVPESALAGCHLIRNASAHSGAEDADGQTETSAEFSPPVDVNQQQGPSCYEPDLISGVTLLFEAALMRCRSEINFFCRIYMQQMVFSGYALVRTLMEMEPNTVFLKKVHASFALECRINNALFRCFENDSFDDSGLTQIFDPGTRAAVRMKTVDPEDALGVHGACYDPCFHSFCANKSEDVMAMFSWNMGYRSAAERDRFMEAFLRAAKWVWLLHRLANAINPPMQIIRVGRGQELDPMYLEPVAMPPMGSCQSCSTSSIPKVEFMVMPGFISPRKVFRCKVYQHYMCK